MDFDLSSKIKVSLVEEAFVPRKFICKKLKILSLENFQLYDSVYLHSLDWTGPLDQSNSNTSFTNHLINMKVI